MPGKVAGVQRQFAVNPLEMRDHAGERTDMLSETGNRGRWRNGPVSAARHHKLFAGTKLDRRRRTVRVPQALATADGALGPSRYIVPRDSRAQQVEADDVIAHVRAKVGSDRLCDLDRSKVDGALSQRIFAERRATATRYAPLRSRNALTCRFPFMRSERHAQQALLPGLNTGPIRGTIPDSCDQQPALLVRYPHPVQVRQLPVEIIAHQHNHEVG